jgi:hypothetical protein
MKCLKCQKPFATAPDHLCADCAPPDPYQWWANRAVDIAVMMKNTGVGELIIRRKTDEKYTFEITPESFVTEARPSALERLSSILEMPADDLREAARGIRDERKKIALLEKLKIIREGNTAILPTGEIVPRGTEGAMEYPKLQAGKCPEATEAAKKVPINQIPDAIQWTESYLETLKVRTLVSPLNERVLATAPEDSEPN